MSAPQIATPPARIERSQPAPFAAPRLRPWSRIWRYLLVVGTGVLLWLIVGNDLLGPNPDDITEDASVVVGGLLVLDIVFGVLAVCLLPLRRRRPTLVAVLTSCFTAVSASAFGAASLAVISLSTRRRWKPVAAVGVVWILCTLLYEIAVRESIPTATINFPSSWVSGAAAIAVYAVCVTTGFYIGARRELLASLRDRVENAEREQALREDSAREAERTRIAREMHDVLAHHISLISLHAGALTYRTDLRRDETAEAAAVIQNNAQLALTELRQILGVLRSGGGDGDGAGRQGDIERRAEPPQPTLHELPALLADSREAGMHVTLDAGGLQHRDGTTAGLALTGLQLAGLSESVSRTAYRIIQETLTNARKHAAGEAVIVRLKKENLRVCIEVENRRMRASAAASASTSTPTPNPATRGSGLGLTGLHERAELAGGTLTHRVTPDDRFIVSARLPWV